jgi:hypothetical protein
MHLAYSCNTSGNGSISPGKGASVKAIRLSPEFIEVDLPNPCRTCRDGSISPAPITKAIKTTPPVDGVAEFINMDFSDCCHTCGYRWISPSGLCHLSSPAYGA